MNKVLNIVNIVLSNRGKSQISKITESFNLRDDLGFDSLDLAELTARIEAEYDVDIFEDGIVITIGDIMRKLK